MNPTLRFELSLADPGTDPAWVDETAYLRRFTTDRGRDNELDRSRAGQASLLVDNRDGRYVASNTQSPHYPYIRPARSVRLTAELPTGFEGFEVGSSFVGDTDRIGGAETELFYLFSGFVDDWPQTWDIGGREASAMIQATDGFVALSQLQFDLTFPGSTINDVTGARIQRVLQVAGWQQSEDDPDWFVKIDNGTVIILGEFGGNDIEVHSKALDYIQKVAETEGGNVFIDGRGDFVFHAADHPLDLDPTEIYGDADPEIGYTDIQVSTGADRIYNDVEVSVSPENVAASVATSVTSIARHWRRSLNIGLLASYPIDLTDTITQRRARQMRDRYSTPRQTITRLVLRPTTAATWRQVLRHEIGDAVLIRKRLPQGDMIEQVSLIEGISIDSPNEFDWQITWNLSAHPEEPVSLLSANQRSLETDTTGWIAESNATISRVSTNLSGEPVAIDGDWVLQITTSAEPAKVKTDPSTGIPATPGLSYRGVAGLILLQENRCPARLEIDWLDSGSSVLSTTTGAIGTLRRQSWRFLEVEGTAPASTAYAVLRVHLPNFPGSTLPIVGGDLFDFYEVG